MARLPSAVSVLVALGATLVAAQQGPTFRTDTSAVSVYATVIDAEGRLVPSLTQADFEVYDDGKRQEMTVFSNTVQPITIVVMLDRSGSMAEHFTLVSDAAGAFLNNLLPGDRARLGSFSNRVQIDPVTFTSDADELRRILKEDLQPAGPTPLWNATSSALTALGREPGRRVVLLFTDGRDNPDRPEASVSYERIQDRVEREETMVYAIGLAGECAPAPETLTAGSAPSGPLFQARPRPGGGSAGRPGRVPVRGGPTARPGARMPMPGGRIGGIGRIPPPLPPVGVGGISKPRDPRKLPDPSDLTWSSGCRGAGPDPNLRTLADRAGGGYFELRGPDNLGATFARVADELHHQYLLAFAPPTLDGKVHKLEVRVRNPELTVRARRTYLAAR
jgi:VWFA-related protein